MHLSRDGGQQLPIQTISTVLIIDGDAASRAALVSALDGLGYASCTAATKDVALAMIDRRPPAAILLDAGLAGSPRPETLLELRARAPQVPVIVITASGCSTIAIEAMRHGASDYLLKPFQVPALSETLAKAVRPHGQGRTAAENRIVWEPVDYELLGSSERMQEVFKLTGQVAASDVTVLIRGESGSGKNLVARAIHRHGGRAEGPFVLVNCASGAQTLFGPARASRGPRAPSGEAAHGEGSFERAHGGTLLLDEIGEMPLGAQARLVAALQERSLGRSEGAERPYPDVRLIVSTSTDLQELVTGGLFRNDLYHQLHVVAIELPPLRERREDIPVLVEHFLRRHAERLGKPDAVLSPEAVQSLAERPWPGNVRELEHCIEQAVVRCSGRVIRPEQTERFGMERPGPKIAEGLEAPALLRQMVRKQFAANPGRAHDAIVSMVEKAVYQEALGLTGGNLSMVSRLLGISRPTVRQRLRDLDLLARREVDGPEATPRPEARA